MRTALRFAAIWLGALALAIAASGAFAQTDVRSDVVQLDPPRPVTTGKRIEVLEFFYYGCPVCYELEPRLMRWLETQAPPYVALRRSPALSKSKHWIAFAKLYFTLEAMGEADRMNWPVYDASHFEGKKLYDKKVMLAWVAKSGIDAKRFAKIYASDEVKAKLAHARELMKEYHVHGVPTIVVDGKYLSSARLAGGTRQLIEVVDKLVRKARSERP